MLIWPNLVDDNAMTLKDLVKVVPLDDDTTRWLARLSAVTRTPEPEIVASMLRQIRIDDEKAHDGVAHDELTRVSVH